MLRSLSPNLTVTELTTDKASLAIVYGRRRIGKSTLIREAIKNRTHIFYQATRVTSSLNLESFKAEVAHGLGVDDLLTGLGDWLAVLHYLAPQLSKSRV
jgi:uncharacterized protein